MSKTLANIWDELEQSTEKGTTSILRAPFGYTGSKIRSLHHILPMIPYAKVYVEPFGGSGSVLMNRKKSKLEVFNDRYAGVVAFYRCMRDPVMTQKLIDWIDWTIHNKEDFIFCKETWQNVNDPVERAGRWLYMMAYSFSGVGRNWGRAKKDGSIAGKLHSKIPIIWQLHNRFKTVQVENQHWYDCLTYYDGPDTVFYLDPPYLNTDPGCYRHNMDESDHKRMLDTIFSCQGFVAVSGYPNSLYEKYDWSDRFEYDVRITAQSATNEVTEKSPLKKRGNVREVLWIKD